MNNFFYKHRQKFILLALAFVIVFTLSSCRTNSSSWYSKPYTTYAQEWIDLWDGGKGFFQALLGWPVNLLSYPAAWLCSKIGQGLGNSYFWGILFTTLIVRTLAWPIYSKQNASSVKMQMIQPEVAKIQAKYQGRTDQRSQQMMQQEMQKLYKKHGINPLGCVFVMILQFPIFMSMYEVVQRINKPITVEINGVITSTYASQFALSNTKVFGLFEMDSSFFNVLSTGPWYDAVFSAVIAILFIGVTLLSQKLSQRPQKYQKVRPQDKQKQQGGQANQMKWMMIIMNVMFGFFALSSTSLGIYWLIGGIYQLFQSQVGRWINDYKWTKANQSDIVG